MPESLNLTVFIVYTVEQHVNKRIFFEYSEWYSLINVDRLSYLHDFANFG